MLSSTQMATPRGDVSTSDVENYVTIRKRVGGGFKHVKVKTTETDDDKRRKEANPKIETVKKKKEYVNKIDDYGGENQNRDKLSKQIESERNIQDETEKQDHDEKENIHTEYRNERTPLADLAESFSLPLSSADLHREDSCENAHYEAFPILRYIQDSVIGSNLTINGPFGTKKVVYCDFTASGRCLSFIEDYIRTFVSPFYANTHSETGRNARQTTKFREEARSIIKKCVNAGKDDVVIFTGSGATSALHKIAWGLKLNQPRVAEETVVLVGPYEHHSNLLLWKEFGAAVVRIRDCVDGTIDIQHLTSELKFWKEKRRQLIVCVSAASNVTGIVTDTDAVSKIAHQHGAFVAFDYAGGGPYLKIDMNSSKHSYKDAVFISPHKFVGGPGSPGVVVAKKWMFKNQVPDRVGGGTVVYVTRELHAYTTDIEGREEGGTPAIIESIRTGLAFQLKNSVGEDVIKQREEYLCCRAFSVWEKNPNLIVLGSHNAERITIFSFIVVHEDTGKTVHFNYISTLLNDLFGIQSRGGCACAGPYGHDLLGISEPMARRLKWFTTIQSGMEASSLQNPLSIMRPGFVRVNLPYFYDDKTIDYIIKAVDMVATHGWKLLSQYTFNPFNGNFVYKGDSTEEEEEEMFSLHDVDYNDNGKFHVNRNPPETSSKISLDDMLQHAEKVFTETTDNVQARHSSASKKLRDLIPKDRHKLRWFLTPQEANDFVTGTRRLRRFKAVMNPRIYIRDGNTTSLPDTFHGRYSDRTDYSPNRETNRNKTGSLSHRDIGKRTLSNRELGNGSMSYRESAIGPISKKETSGHIPKRWDIGKGRLPKHSLKINDDIDPLENHSNLLRPPLEDETEKDANNEKENSSKDRSTGERLVFPKI